MNIADSAWMAGLFEGEGSISISKKKGYCYLQLVSTDEDVLYKFARLAACKNKITYCPRRPHQTKDAYKWQVGNREDVTRLLETWMPFLGDRRRAKANEVLSFYNDRNNRSKSAAAITVGQVSQLGD
jgi:hypothetical protein